MTRYAETVAEIGVYPLRRRDRAAMVLALECVKRDSHIGHARMVLSRGGAVADRLCDASYGLGAWVDSCPLRVRLALALRTLLRVDAWLATGNTTGDDLSPWDVTCLPPGHPYSCADETWEPYQTHISGTWYRRLKAAPLWEIRR